MDNFMVQYDSSEAYIRAIILQNRGSKNIIARSELIELLQKCASDEDASDINYSKMSKAELFDLLVTRKGPDIYSRFSNIGVSSYSFQKKFGITHKDVLKMAKHGFIQICGKEEFYMHGKTRYANMYSPYDYFRLTPEEVHTWLAHHFQRKFTPQKETKESAG